MDYRELVEQAVKTAELCATPTWAIKDLTSSIYTRHPNFYWYHPEKKAVAVSTPDLRHPSRRAVTVLNRAFGAIFNELLPSKCEDFQRSRESLSIEGQINSSPISPGGGSSLNDGFGPTKRKFQKTSGHFGGKKFSGSGAGGEISAK